MQTKKLIYIVLWAGLMLFMFKGTATAQVAMPSVMGLEHFTDVSEQLLQSPITGTSLNVANVLWRPSYVGVGYNYLRSPSKVSHLGSLNMSFSSRYVGADVGGAWIMRGKSSTETASMGYTANAGLAIAFVPDYWSMGGGYRRYSMLSKSGEKLLVNTFSGGTSIRLFEVLYLGFAFDMDMFKVGEIKDKRNHYNAGLAVASRISDFYYRLETYYTYLDAVKLSGLDIGKTHHYGMQLEMIIFGLALGMEYTHTMADFEPEALDVKKITGKLGYINFEGLRFIGSGSYVMHQTASGYNGAVTIQYGF